MKTYSLLLATLIAFLMTFTAQARPEIDGYCPVCYIAAGQAKKGTSSFKAEHKGKTYYFIAQEALDAFKKEPDKYIPAYDGNCALNMAEGKKTGSRGEIFKVIGGKIYLFKNEKASESFAADSTNHIQKADTEWAKMMEKK